MADKGKLASQEWVKSIKDSVSSDKDLLSKQFREYVKQETKFQREWLVVLQHTWIYVCFRPSLEKPSLDSSLCAVLGKES